MRFLTTALLFAAARLAAADCWTYPVAQGVEFPSPDAACQQATLEKYGHTNSQAQMVPNDPYQYYCHEVTQDGSLNYFTLIQTSRQPQAYCSTPVCGPYGDIPDGPNQGFAGQPFTNQAQIRAENIARWDQGRMISDVSTPRLQDVLYGWLGIYEECTQLFNMVIKTGCSAEVHHIIPVKDTNGCPCGSNSNKNALLISRRVNGLLGNLPPKQLFLSRIPKAPGCP
jgi:hypothetical protein